MVLLQDAFPKENSPFSIAVRASYSLREEEVKDSQKRNQAMTLLTGQIHTAPEPGKRSRVVTVTGPIDRLVMTKAKAK